MSILERLFGRARPQAGSDAAPQEAVFVYLDGSGLSDEIYEQYDVATLEDRLVEVISQGRLGEFDGNEIGQSQAILFMYGHDAERLFSGIESTLRAYPLCRNARVVIRRGGPGAFEREVRLDAA